MKWILLVLLLFGCSWQPMKPMFFELKDFRVEVYSKHIDKHRYPPGFGYIIGTGGNKRIIVEGYMYKGKLIFQHPGALGHELWHLINQKYPKLVWNPDKIGDE